MAEFGFISDKLEIKFLILYIASRLVGPVPFEILQDLSMCDAGVDYFDFSECLADLVQTEHLSLNEDQEYLITEKGRVNGAACESSLAYSVRMQVDKNIVGYNELLKRKSLVGAVVEPRNKGGYTVKLSLSDDLDPIMHLELLVTRESIAKDIQKRFKDHAEEIYSKLLSSLCGSDN